MDPAGRSSLRNWASSPPRLRGPGRSNGSEWGFTGIVNLVGTGRSIMSGNLLTSRFPGAEAHFYNARRPIPEDVVADISGPVAMWWWAQPRTEVPARRTLRTT